MVKNNLELFKERLTSIYPDLSLDILKNLESDRLVSFRLNPLKKDPKKIKQELLDLGFHFIEGPLVNSYILTSISRLKLSETPHFLNGEVYIQSLSSMLPVTILDPKPLEHVLDLCASPGSKTSQAYLNAHGKCYLTVVENNLNRFHQLKHNLETQGVSNVTYFKINAAVLSKTHPHLLGTFDKVICDVPCSNMGVVRFSQPQSLSNWHPRSSKNLSFLQKKILATGINLLKSGGILVYSTCTYEAFENEMVINWALDTFSNISLLPFDHLNVPGVPGFTHFGSKAFSSNLSCTFRILPDNYWDGFFIAKLVKK